MCCVAPARQHATRARRTVIAAIPSRRRIQPTMTVVAGAVASAPVSAIGSTRAAARGLTMPKRIDTLTDAQRAQMDGWADKWIEIGLRVGHTDWDVFAAAAKACYRYAKIPWPDVVVRVPSPLVLAFAAPAAALAIELIERQKALPKKQRLSRDAVRGAVDGAVG